LKAGEVFVRDLRFHAEEEDGDVAFIKVNLLEIFM
jgi:hypothetical protein